MAEYVVGLVRAITNGERMAEYRAVAGEALAKHGGEVVVPPTAPERVEGNAEPPTAIVLLCFPSAEAARAWRDDPELASVHAMRRAGADISFFLIENPTG